MIPSLALLKSISVAQAEAAFNYSVLFFEGVQYKVDWSDAALKVKPKELYVLCVLLCNSNCLVQNHSFLLVQFFWSLLAQKPLHQDFVKATQNCVIC